MKLSFGNDRQSILGHLPEPPFPERVGSFLHGPLCLEAKMLEAGLGGNPSGPVHEYASGQQGHCHFKEGAEWSS